jgi:plasmid maintenance system antidote protein VapI
MPDKWTGQVLGKMHINGIRAGDVAQEMGVSRPRVSQILNGENVQVETRQRLESAVDAIIEKRKRGETDA